MDWCLDSSLRSLGICAQDFRSLTYLEVFVWVQRYTEYMYYTELFGDLFFRL